MTLIATAELPSRSPLFIEALVLPMRTEDGTVVRVYVAHDVLLAFEPPPPCVSGIPQFEGEYRSRIERIASVKYDSGLIERDGSVLITQDDVDY